MIYQYTTESTETQAAVLVMKIKHYLITTMGRVLEEADTEEFYRALCYALREQILINWQATARSWQKKDARMVFYLSLEYLPGRFLNNNLTNLKNIQVVQLVLKKTGRTLPDILSHEYDPGLGNGGLGRLASCFLDSLATLKMPARGYGLRYQYGLFEQQLLDGVQIEKPDMWLLNENPWEFRRDQRMIITKFCGNPVKRLNEIGDEVYDLSDPEAVWAIPYDIPIIGYSEAPDFAVVTLRLWSTKESPRNFLLQRYNAGRLDQAAENTTLTDVLYPTDIHDVGKRVRLKQEFLMVSASVQDILRYYLTTHTNLDEFHDKVRIQINDTHPAMIIAELMRVLTNYYSMPWKKAWEVTQECTSYTNHTILSEALEQWDQSLYRYLLPRQYKIIERINLDFCTSVRRQFPGDEERVRKMSILENSMVRMANLAIVGSHKINGVAALHSEILKKSTFKEFYESFPDKFTNVTNGVTHRRWLLTCNPELAAFITERIGNKWVTHFQEISKLASFASDEQSQKTFLEIKRKDKQRLLDALNRDWRSHDASGKQVSPDISLDASALFDVQAKRVHEYKRQLLNAIRLIMKYHEIQDNPNQPYVKRLVLFAGKAASSYETAKTIIRLIHCIAKKINRDPIVSQYLNVHYIENYNVSHAEIIIPAADLSEQISTAGMEASGTGNMKFAMNGALTIGTEDGANIEMRENVTDAWWPFKFGCSAQEIADMKAARSYNAWEIYSTNPKIKRAIDSLRDRSLITQEVEHQSLSSLYYTLLEGSWGSTPDRYFVLKDLVSYCETQQKVDDLYATPMKWAEYAIHNIAGMGNFSTDRSIQEYCDNIWSLQACDIDPEIFDTVYRAYIESTPSSLL
ncbi:MAG: glycogen/starch/alpha-glucan family phosphorylase [Verrucomicrobia bacterium]|nr:glycogen/starch/alpha-glucan family phosphorylase [Verrucomicrobiota bacterium]